MSSRRSRLLASWLLPLLLATLASSTALGDGGESGALAEALFRSGRELMAEGKYDEACPKFAESNRIDPKLGTLMNLALCHDKAGSTARAWAAYVQAADIAKRIGQSEREKVARERALALEPTLAHVIIDAKGSSRAAEVRLDGETIGAAAFGTPVPVDPGEHTVRATAPGRMPFSESFNAPPGSAARTVHVPELELDPSAAAAVAPAAEPSVPPPHGAGRRTWGWGFIAGGAATVALGAYFGVRAISDRQDAERLCASGACVAGQSTNADGLTQAHLADGALVLGAGAAAIGLYLVLTRPREPAAPPSHASFQGRPRFTQIVPWAAARGSGISVGGAF